MKERTASSFSGRHFGHYKAAAHSDFLLEVHAKAIELVTKTGATPERLSKGLSVTLEKIADVALVTKHRAILLVETDFNFHNRLIFGNRMMKLARENGLVPEEVYSEKGKRRRTPSFNMCFCLTLPDNSGDPSWWHPWTRRSATIG